MGVTFELYILAGANRVLCLYVCIRHVHTGFSFKLYFRYRELLFSVDKLSNSSFCFCCIASFLHLAYEWYNQILHNNLLFVNFFNKCSSQQNDCSTFLHKLSQELRMTIILLVRQTQNFLAEIPHHHSQYLSNQIV